ncbi:DNA polymerase zeta, partial [Scheffersomyces stipitis CBS 6054]
MSNRQNDITNVFSVQINDYDSYQTFPSKLDNLYGNVNQVPVIRIYGTIAVPKTTPNLVFNVLVHVHNYYPYLYVDCFEADKRKLASKEHIDNVINYLEASMIDSFKHDHQNSRTRRKFIAGVSVCRGTPIYGFQLGHRLVYRISLLSPKYKTRLSKLLYERKIDLSSLELDSNLKRPKKKALVYEAHIPYFLQFLADFNLFGCGWLYIDKNRNLGTKGIYFRSPVISEIHRQAFTATQIASLKNYLSNFINDKNILQNSVGSESNSTKFDRVGKSLLEIDINTNSIINRNSLELRELHNDFFELQDYRKLLEDDPQHKTHGYKFDREGNQRIYLASLKLVYEDLKYQCNIRGSTFQASSDTSPDDEKLNYFGTGETEWSNYQELSELLKYVVKLNGQTSLDLEKYSKKFIACKTTSIVDLMRKPSDVIEEPAFRTAFEEIEFEKTNRLNNSQLQFGTDLVNWKSDIRMLYNEKGDIQIPSSFDEFTFSSDTNTSFSSTSIEAFDIGFGSNSYEVLIPEELTKSNISESVEKYGIMKINYEDPFYDKQSDMPSKPLIFANKKIIVPLNNLSSIARLPMSKNIESFLEQAVFKSNIDFDHPKFDKWQYLPEAPSKSEIDEWLQDGENRLRKKAKKFRSQIEPGVTQSNDFKFSYNSEKVKRRNDGFNRLSDFHLEAHVNTNDPKFSPDPLKDPVSIISYYFDDTNNMFENSKNRSGILIFNDNMIDVKMLRSAMSFLENGTEIEVFDNELHMVNRLVSIIEKFDPDILSGYEVNASSWGYLIERFRTVYEVNLLADFSRGSYKTNGKFGDRWGYTHTSNIKINGRHIINVWRLLRHELSLTSYSLENVSYHLLHQSLPKFSNFQLSEWLRSNKFQNILTVFRYYQRRIALVIKIIEVQELVTRNVENSRLIGIDFNSNFYRGSQFRIESILSRLAKSENLLLNSPSKQQVFEMKPIECIPLIMEPNSNFYKSPLVVLDFQSLYPSVMIAYNYCFSTLLGRLHNFNPNKNEIGYLKNLSLPPGLVDLMEKENAITLSPNGYMFVKSNVRKSILAKMLEEILSTRVKVKEVMKLFRDDRELTRLYDARQLALKLIANVTYGYTSATFSGRMPNPDISDAIVSTGREILSKSIEIINNGNFGAKVVYGDTDSLFIYFPGKSRSEAFSIGRHIAQYITDQFPDPIKLKFEKVYHPCVLLTKKRYVGYSYEYENQTSPKFDAKGIETVRRDGIPAQQKIVEKSLRILFETKNLSRVKEYVQKQFHKISINKVSVIDFCFAKEVRYGTYKNEKYLPPGAIVAQKKVDEDHRKEPQYRERVPYVVVSDPTKTRIKDRCISPEEFIDSYKTTNPYILDYEYYITRVLIPPLERIFNLIGVDVKGWYRELPKFQKNSNKGILNISRNIRTHACLGCGDKLQSSTSSYLCSSCRHNELQVVTNLLSENKKNETNIITMNSLCQRCVNRNFEGIGTNVTKSCADECQNRDCSVYYNKFKAHN